MTTCRSNSVLPSDENLYCPHCGFAYGDLLLLAIHLLEAVPGSSNCPSCQSEICALPGGDNVTVTVEETNRAGAEGFCRDKGTGVFLGSNLSPSSSVQDDPLSLETRTIEEPPVLENQFNGHQNFNEEILQAGDHNVASSMLEISEEVVIGPQDQPRIIAAFSLSEIGIPAGKSPPHSGVSDRKVQHAARKTSINPIGNDRVFKCDRCSYIAGTLWALQNHQRSGLAKPKECATCSYTCCSLNGLRIHEKIHSPPAKDKIQTVRNRNAKPSEEGSRLKCTECGYLSTTKRNFKAHKNTHTARKSYECCFCKYITPYWCNWKKHERVHSGEKPFKCESCGLAFSQPNALKNHSKIHRTEISSQQ